MTESQIIRWSFVICRCDAGRKCETNRIRIYTALCIATRGKLEGTHRVRTHAELLSLLVYPKVIPYTKFEHFGIIRFLFTYAPNVSVTL